MNKDLTELVFILDRSGSMAGLEDDTVGGFNAMVEKQKKEPGAALLSAVLFSFLLSWLSGKLPLLSSVSEGTRIMILTVIIASAAAALFPVKEAAYEE